MRAREGKGAIMYWACSLFLLFMIKYLNVKFTALGFKRSNNILVGCVFVCACVGEATFFVIYYRISSHSLPSPLINQNNLTLMLFFF